MLLCILCMLLHESIAHKVAAIAVSISGSPKAFRNELWVRNKWKRLWLRSCFVLVYVTTREHSAANDSNGRFHLLFTRSP
eukprot:5762165-Lingulodinium_polyedra.AAC.1